MSDFAMKTSSDNLFRTKFSQIPNIRKHTWFMKTSDFSSKFSIFAPKLFKLRFIFHESLSIFGWVCYERRLSGRPSFLIEKYPVSTILLILIFGTRIQRS